MGRVLSFWMPRCTAGRVGQADCLTACVAQDAKDNKEDKLLERPWGQDVLQAYMEKQFGAEYAPL